MNDELTSSVPCTLHNAFINELLQMAYSFSNYHHLRYKTRNRTIEKIISKALSFKFM